MDGSRAVDIGVLNQFEAGQSLIGSYIYTVDTGLGGIDIGNSLTAIAGNLNIYAGGINGS